MNLFISLIAFMIAINSGYSFNWYQDNNPIFLNEQIIGQVLLRPNQIKIITFIIYQCQLCMHSKKAMQDISQKITLKGSKMVGFYYIDCNLQSKLCEDMRIPSVPLIMVLNQHGLAMEQYLVSHFGIEQVARLALMAIQVLQQQNESPQIKEEINTQIPMEKQKLRKRTNLKKHHQQPIKQKNQINGDKIPTNETQSTYKRKKVVENVLKQRSKKSKFINLNIQQNIANFIVIGFSIAGFLYIKRLLIKSNKIYQDSNYSKETQQSKQSQLKQHDSKNNQ